MRRDGINFPFVQDGSRVLCKQSVEIHRFHAMGSNNKTITVFTKDSFGRQSQNERSIFKKKQIITAASFGWMQIANAPGVHLACQDHLL